MEKQTSKQTKARKKLGRLKKGAKASTEDEYWKRSSKVCWGAVAASRVTVMQQGLSKIFSCGSPATPPLTPFSALQRGGYTKQISGHSLASPPLRLFQEDTATTNIPLSPGSGAVTSSVVDSPAAANALEDKLNTSLSSASDCPPEQSMLCLSPPPSSLFLSSSSPSNTTTSTTTTTTTTTAVMSNPLPSLFPSDTTLSSSSGSSIPTTTSITTVFSNVTTSISPHPSSSTPAPSSFLPSSSTSATSSLLPSSFTPTTSSLLPSHPSHTSSPLLPVGSLASETLQRDTPSLAAVTPTLGAVAVTAHSSTNGGGPSEQQQQPEFIGGDCPAIRSPIVEYLTPGKDGKLTDEQKVLALSNQVRHISLESFFSPSMRKTVRKLGEGVFGEVFHCFSEERDNLALKIVPIEGKVKVNDEKQKTFSEVLPEMVISKELSDLALDKENSLHYSKNFVHIHKMGLCRSAYPDFLLDAWDQWDDDENSENDRPDIFRDDQQYIVFAYENAGIALERFTFQSSNEAKSVVVQIAGALAVAEEALKFEHRDMHRGNVLVRRTREPHVIFVMNGQRYEFRSHGVLVTVIDYTLSRLSQGDCVSYNDLNNLPWLFQGKKEDIHFDTYRDMQNCTGNDWSKFAPKTNALWLHYLVNKISMKGRHKHVTRKQMQTKLTQYLNKFTSYDSAKDIFLSLFATNANKSVKAQLK